MRVTPQHLLQQGPMVRTLLTTAATTIGDKLGLDRPTDATVPGPMLTDRIDPRPQKLIRDYVRHVGGSPSWYRGVLPPHMFHQWGFPLLAQAAARLPYDLSKTLNAGCSISVHKPLPAHEPLLLTARLEDLDDNGQRVLCRSRLVTSTPTVEDALTCEVNAIIMLKRKDKGAKRSEKPRVPVGAREIDRWRLGPDCGSDFAVLTGDLNPVHWVPAYAKMAGFRSVILHGFSTMARSIESLNRQLWSGRTDRLKEASFRLVKPIVLPSKPSVFIDDNGGIYVGHAPGGPAYLTGTFKENKGEPS